MKIAVMVIITVEGATRRRRMIGEAAEMSTPLRHVSLSGPSSLYVQHERSYRNLNIGFRSSNRFTLAKSPVFAGTSTVAVLPPQ